MSVVRPVAEPGRVPVGARIVSRLTGGALYIVVALVGVLWLIPTLGLFISSLRKPSDITNSGWWNVFSHHP